MVETEADIERECITNGGTKGANEGLATAVHETGRAVTGSTARVVVSGQTLSHI